MLRRTIQALFWALVALAALAFLAAIPTAVTHVWPALIIAAALTLIVAIQAHHERTRP